ncbi:MAG: putative response regulator [uncultured bacterium]|nr:MAG: putative response regulator [uncultured bacterium]HBD05371.1 response regulator [Candidatus Uhrbacteria bacterium]
MATKGKTVLLVEDDAFLSKVLAQRLEKEGIKVEKAVDGVEAVEKAKAIKPDLILLDLILPKKSGSEALEEIRAIAGLKSLPVVVLSNLGQQEDVERLKKLGVKDYLVKADYSLTKIVENIIKHL